MAFKFHVFFSLFLISVAAVSVSSHVFQVNGKRGWIKPSRNNTRSYNNWAAKKRFHVGDTVYFKYHNDSVLVVNLRHYRTCNTSNPIAKFDDGKTVFKFDRSGFFYFISGKLGHCNSGQKLIIQVMHHPTKIEPAASPKAPEPTQPPQSPGGDGGGWDSNDWGPPGLRPFSATGLSAASPSITALGGLLSVLYLFM